MNRIKHNIARNRPHNQVPIATPRTTIKANNKSLLKQLL